jgi:hypothetical protein
MSAPQPGHTCRADLRNARSSAWQCALRRGGAGQAGGRPYQPPKTTGILIVRTRSHPSIQPFLSGQTRCLWSTVDAGCSLTAPLSSDVVRVVRIQQDTAALRSRPNRRQDFVIIRAAPISDQANADPDVVSRHRRKSVQVPSGPIRSVESKPWGGQRIGTCSNVHDLFASPFGALSCCEDAAARATGDGGRARLTVVTRGCRARRPARADAESGLFGGGGQCVARGGRGHAGRSEQP